MEAAAIVLAAGAGTRMKSKTRAKLLDGALERFVVSVKRCPVEIRSPHALPFPLDVPHAHYRTPLRGMTSACSGQAPCGKETTYQAKSRSWENYRGFPACFAGRFL